jgi:hypothetical protein
MGTQGKRICCLQGLIYAAEEKRAVVVPLAHCWRKPTPAAFMIQQHGDIINRLLNLGIYIYEKTTKGEQK